MMFKKSMTILAAVCAFSAAGVAFAQGDVEFENSGDYADDADEALSEEDDGDAPAFVLPKSPKAGKQHKSKSKSGKSGKSGKQPKSDKPSISDNSPSPSAEKSTAPAAPASGTTLKYNGLVAAGVDFNRKVNRKEGNAVESKRVVKGELELSAQPVKKVRAEIGIEYNINGRAMVADSLGVRKFVKIIDPMSGTAALTDVDLELIKGLPLGPFLAVDKIYAQYNVVDNGTVRLGIMKKSFGLEERAGLDERYFLKRSIISDGLEDLGFLDHDLTAAYRHDLFKDALRLTGAFSWSLADSLVYLQNYSAHYRPAKNMEILLAGIISHYSAKDTLILESGNKKRLPAILTSFAASLSFRYDAAVCVSEAEVTVGTNPNILLITNRPATLLGARLQEQFPIDVDTKILRRVVPVAEAAVFTADLDSAYTETQIKAGVTLGFAKNSAFQFRNNFGMIIRTDDIRAVFEKDKKSGSKVKRYRFDSEAVVVF